MAPATAVTSGAELPGEGEAPRREAVDLQSTVSAPDMAPLRREHAGGLQPSENGGQSPLRDTESLTDPRLTESRWGDGPRGKLSLSVDVEDHARGETDPVELCLPGRCLSGGIRRRKGGRACGGSRPLCVEGWRFGRRLRLRLSGGGFLRDGRRRDHRGSPLGSRSRRSWMVGGRMGRWGSADPESDRQVERGRDGKAGGQTLDEPERDHAAPPRCPIRGPMPVGRPPSDLRPRPVGITALDRPGPSSPPRRVSVRSRSPPPDARAVARSSSPDAGGRVGGPRPGPPRRPRWPRFLGPSRT